MAGLFREKKDCVLILPEMHLKILVHPIMRRIKVWSNFGIDIVKMEICLECVLQLENII